MNEDLEKVKRDYNDAYTIIENNLKVLEKEFEFEPRFKELIKCNQDMLKIVNSQMTLLSSISGSHLTVSERLLEHNTAINQLISTVSDISDNQSKIIGKLELG